MMYDNPDAVRMYRVCGENGLPVLMHFDYELGGRPWPYWYGGGIEALEGIALCPETNFIGHAPGFWAHISGASFIKPSLTPKAHNPSRQIELLLRKVSQPVLRHFGQAPGLTH